MDGISWTHAGKRFAIYRRSELPGVLSLAKTQTPGGKTGTRHPFEKWQRVHLREVDEVRRTMVLVREELWKLRHLLARDCYNTCRISDDEILDRATIMLVRGELVLFERFTNEAHEQSLASRPAPPGPRVGPAIPPTRLRPPSKNAEIVAPQIEDAGQAFDHDAQAATLRRAAVNGIPFCEICEPNKRGRRSPSRAGVAA